MAQPKSSIIRYDEVLNTHLEGVLKHCMFSKKHLGFHNTACNNRLKKISIVFIMIPIF